MSIKKHRGLNTYTAKRLRRARNLYVKICTKAIWESKDNSVLHHMIQRMSDCGMYAYPSQIPWRDGRYSICRKLWRQAGGKCGTFSSRGWFLWLAANGFDRNFNRVGRCIKIA